MKRIIFLIMFCLGLPSTSFAAYVSNVTIEKSCPNTVALSWIGTASVGFNVYRSSTMFGTKTFVGSTNSVTKSGNDNSVASGFTYYYWVEAVDNAATYMSITSASTTVPSSLSTPFSPTVQRVGNTIDITWSYYNNKNGMYIYRSTDYGSYVFLKTISDAFTSSWIDATVLPGHTYSYKISAYNECGETALSFGSSYINTPTLPDLKVDSLTVFVSNDTLYGRYIISNIGDQAAGSFQTVVLCNSSNIYSYLTSTPLNGGYYYIYTFTYKATTQTNNISVYADYSNSITESNETNNTLLITKTVIPPSAPNLTIPTDNQINIPLTESFLWNNPGGATSYRFQLTKDPAFNSISIDNSNIYSSFFTATNLETNSIYYWRVYAVNGGGNSSWSTIRTFTTIPPSPSVPQLSTPENGSIDQQISLPITWTGVSGAGTYHVQVSTDISFANIVLNDSTLVIPTRNIGQLSAASQYFWRVSAKNAGGKSVWSQIWSFTTVPAPTGAPILLSPSNNATDQPLSLTFTWNTVAGSDSYYLQVSTDATFANLIVSDSALVTTSKNTNILLPSSQYFWRVSSKNAGGRSEWSQVSTFKTIPPPTGAPILISPINNASDQLQSVELIWNTVTGTDCYFMQVASDVSFENLIVEDTILLAPSKSISSLFTSTQYFWRVGTKNAGGKSAWSQIWSFTTVPAPTGAPILLSPLNNATDQKLSLTLTWNTVAGSDSYYLQVSTDATFANLIVSDSALVTTSKNTNILLPSSQYFWRVSSKNAGGRSEWSQIGSFTTVPTPTGAPILLSPLNNATDQPLSLMLTWNAISGANTYHIQIASDISFSNIITDDSTLVLSTKNIDFLIANSQYYWHVNSKNAGGNSAWSQTWIFSILPFAPTIPNAITPLSDAIIIRDSIRFIWYPSKSRVDKYLLEVFSDSLMNSCVYRDSTLIDTSTIIRGLSNNSPFWWHVKAHNIAGWGTNSPVTKFTLKIPITGVLPTVYSFSTNFDIGHQCSFTYAHPLVENVLIEIYDVKGRVIASEKITNQCPGYHRFNIEGFRFAGGRYIVNFVAGKYRIVKGFCAF